MLRYKMPAKEATSDKSPKFVSLPRPDISNIKTPSNRKQRKAAKKLEKKADTETRKQVKDTQKWKYICYCRDPDCGIGPMNVRVRCN